MCKAEKYEQHEVHTHTYRGCELMLSPSSNHTARRTSDAVPTRTQALTSVHYPIVKVFYQETRRAFIHWRQNGSPRIGFNADCMQRKRKNFRDALTRCRKNWNSLVPEAPATVSFGPKYSWGSEDHSDQSLLTSLVDGTQKTLVTLVSSEMWVQDGKPDPDCKFSPESENIIRFLIIA